MTEQNILQEMIDDELRRLAKEAIDRMDDQGRAELLEWVKKELEVENAERQNRKGEAVNGTGGRENQRFRRCDRREA